MKILLILILLIIFSSCKKENLYEKALDRYIKEDITYRNNRIKYQMAELNGKRIEQPSKYSEICKFANDTIAPLYANFDKILNSKNLDTINLNLRFLKSKIQKLIHQKHLKDRIFINSLENFPSEISQLSDRYDLFREVKKTEQKFFNTLLSRQMMESTGPGYSPRTSVYPVRIDDFTIMINISDGVLKANPEFFNNNEAFIIDNLTDKRDTLLPYQIHTFTSYMINTKSDTLHLKANLKTKKNIGIVVSEYDSLIVVGKRTYFNWNPEIFDSLINK